MKKLFLVLAGLSLVSGVIFCQSKIRITNGEWEPFLSENSSEYGFGSHIVTEAFKLEGIEIEYGFFPWTHGFETAKSGDLEAGTYDAKKK